MQIKRIFIFLSAVFLLCQTPTLFLPHLKFHGIFNNSLGIFSNKLCPPLQHQTLCKCIAATIKKAHCASSVVLWREKNPSNQNKQTHTHTKAQTKLIPKQTKPKHPPESPNTQNIKISRIQHRFCVRAFVKLCPHILKNTQGAVIIHSGTELYQTVSQCPVIQIYLVHKMN